MSICNSCKCTLFGKFTYYLVPFLVNRIKEQYKVSVRIPQDSERCGLVRIEGDPQGVQLARKELMDMAQRMVRRSIRKSQERSAYEAHLPALFQIWPFLASLGK